ncbi:MAG: outer membrane lipoprotein carrier protein LolA [Deltaproteobacteria bacterium]|nr:outer membrane lipoprotein carrier protein LolA [Candidatus Zymogenaceae bacterium]
MKRISIALVALLLLCASARAVDVDTTLSGLQSYWGAIDTFTARFVQNKHLSLFSDDMASRGTFAYKKPGDMVFRYDPPDDTIIGFKPGDGLVTYYFPSIKKATRYHFSPGADIPKGMSFGLGPIGDITALKKLFIITAGETGGITTMTLVPKDRNDSKKEIAVSFRKDYTPLKVRISEKNGDFAVLDFSGQRVNPPVSDSLFEVKLPRDVTVEDVGK